MLTTCFISDRRLLDINELFWLFIYNYFYRYLFTNNYFYNCFGYFY